MAEPSGLKTVVDRWGWPAVVAVVVGVLLVVGVLGALAPDTSENPDTGEIADNGSDNTPDATLDDDSDSSTTSERTDDTDSGGSDTNDSPGDGYDGSDSENNKHDDENDNNGVTDDPGDTGENDSDESTNGSDDKNITDDTGDEEPTDGTNNTDSGDTDDDGAGNSTDNDTGDVDNTDDGETNETDETTDGTDDTNETDDTTELAWTVTVTDVVDGDTVDISYQNGSTDTVRLLGIDTPEVHTSVSPAEFEGVPDTPAARECLGTVGGRASAYVRNRLDGETVTLRGDPQADRRGVYGRILGYIVENGTNLNYDLVAQGYARVFDSPFRQSDRFYAAETDAQSTQRRVWACRAVEDAPADETDDSETSRALTVARIHADAAGNDHENLNDEYLVFANTGESALELGGWTVADEVDHTYRFPAGFTLAAGERVTLYTGSGSHSATDLYWGQERAVWNNGGDTILVSNADGEVVLEESY